MFKIASSQILSGILTVGNGQEYCMHLFGEGEISVYDFGREKSRTTVSDSLGMSVLLLTPSFSDIID